MKRERKELMFVHGLTGVVMIDLDRWVVFEGRYCGDQVMQKRGEEEEAAGSCCRKEDGEGESEAAAFLVSPD